MHVGKRLSETDVKAIFDCISDNKLPQGNLSFKVIRLLPNVSKISPPPLEFHDGIYALFSAPSKTESAVVPSALSHLVMTDEDFSDLATCHWRSSGLKSHRSNEGSTILQRYCYPNGDQSYSGNRGGSVWTMRDENGNEDFSLKILQIYQTQKRSSTSSSGHLKKKKKSLCVEVDIDNLMNGELIPTPVHYQDPSFDPRSIDEYLLMSNVDDPSSLLQFPRSAAVASIQMFTSADTFTSYTASPQISVPQANLSSFTRRLHSLSHDIRLSNKEDQPTMNHLLHDWAKKINQQEH